MKISFGENSKLVVKPDSREKIRKFYGNVLGCRIVEKEDVDIVWIGTSFHIAMRYEVTASSEDDLLNSIWLELRVDEPNELKKRILEFGIKEIEYWDKEHFYFQAPGGQVFRLVQNTEEMTKWRE